MLARIPDKRVQRKISRVIDKLAEDPELQGYALVDDLKGYRSVRAVGQRYRVIYRVDRNGLQVRVGAIGIRKAGDQKDVYELAHKMFLNGELP